MKLIVDTNRIIAALIKDSTSRKIIYYADADFYGINFSKDEIEEHKEEFIRKIDLSEGSFDFIYEKVTSKIVFLNDELIRPSIEEAKKIMFHIDPDDVPFIAAALATGADIWSDDPHFTKQKTIKIWRTAELSKLL